MLTVVEYKHHHLASIDPKECHEGETPRLILRKAVTIMDGDMPLAIFGAYRFTQGVHHIWALFSERVREKPVAFAKTCRNLQKFYDETSGAHRFQVDVREGYYEGIRWAEFFGFSREGLMRSFTADGSNCWILGRRNPCLNS